VKAGRLASARPGALRIAGQKAVDPYAALAGAPCNADGRHARCDGVGTGTPVMPAVGHHLAEASMANAMAGCRPENPARACYADRNLPGAGKLRQKKPMAMR